MLTDKQKKQFKRITVFTLIFGFLMLIPVRTFLTGSIWQYVTFGVKFGLIPFLMIVFSIKANKIKYRQIKENRYRSKVVNTMSYFPLSIYLITVILHALHTMTLSDDTYKVYEPLGVTLWGVLFVIMLAYLVYVIIQILLINKIVMSFNRKKHVFFDLSFFVMTVCFAVISSRVISSYYQAFNELAFYKKGDPLLLGIFIVAFALYFFVKTSVKDLIDVDETLVNVNIAELSDSDASILTRKTEYNRAYEAVLNNFENYFAVNRVSYEKLSQDPTSIHEQLHTEPIKDEVEEVETETPQNNNQSEVQETPNNSDVLSKKEQRKKKKNKK